MKKALLILLLPLLLVTSCKETRSGDKVVVPNCFECICFHTTFGNNGIRFLRDKATNNMYYDSNDGLRPYYNSKSEIMSYEEFVEVHVKVLHEENMIY